SSRRRHTRFSRDWSSDVCSSDLFCLPSVTAQSNRNFKWLIYFDVTTPQRFIDQINQLTAPHDNIRTFFIDGMPSFYPEVKKFIRSEERRVGKEWRLRWWVWCRIN